MRFAYLLLTLLVLTAGIRASADGHYAIQGRANATETIRGQLIAAAGVETAEVYVGVNAGGEKGYVIALSTSIEGQLVSADRALFLSFKAGLPENIFDPGKKKFRTYAVYNNTYVGIARSQEPSGPVFLENLCGGNYASVCRLSFDGEVPKIAFN